MASNHKLEKAVFALGAGADVINHLVPHTLCGRIADDPDMGPTPPFYSPALSIDRTAKLDGSPKLITAY